MFDICCSFVVYSLRNEPLYWQSNLTHITSLIKFPQLPVARLNKDELGDALHLLYIIRVINVSYNLQNIGKKMTCQEFTNNLDGLNAGQDFPRDLLKVRAAYLIT